MDATCAQRLNDLLAGRHTTTGDELDAGAELIVTDPDGAEAFRAALARHHRFDPDDPHVLWVRPLVGGQPSPTPDQGPYTWSLNITRRRGLTYTHAYLDDHGDVILHLVGGQTARITPASGTQLQILHRWDHFTLNTLTPTEEAALEALDADSWHGRFA